MAEPPLDVLEGPFKEQTFYAATGRMSARSSKIIFQRPYYLRTNIAPKLSLDDSQLSITLRDLEDNRSFRTVNPTINSNIPSPRPSEHGVVHQPAELLGCAANVTLIDFLAHGKFSDFLLGDWIDSKGDATRVVIQVARPALTDANQSGRPEAWEVESSFLQEAQMYHGKLKYLQGNFVPKFFGLWVGVLPKPTPIKYNIYTSERLFLLITEYIELSYQDFDEVLGVHSPTPDFLPCPKSIPANIWPGIRDGVKECYDALERFDVIHNAYEPEHWRCDVRGLWRVLDFTKAYRASIPQRSKPIETVKTNAHKAVRFEGDDEGMFEESNGEMVHNTVA